MTPPPIAARQIPPHTAPSLYPAPFAERVAGRSKHKLGDYFGLTRFGVNLTTLAPGAESALLHHHSQQDEFIYILAGMPTLRYGAAEYLLQPGDCIGFRAGCRLGHQLLNRTGLDATYFEVGDRSPDDAVTYPEDDLAFIAAADGRWQVLHKDGRPY